MGLTMGLMNAVAAREAAAAAGVIESNTDSNAYVFTPMAKAVGTPVVSYPSPAFGVFGSPGMISGRACGQFTEMT